MPASQSFRSFELFRQLEASGTKTPAAMNRILDLAKDEDLPGKNKNLLQGPQRVES